MKKSKINQGKVAGNENFRTHFPHSSGFLAVLSPNKRFNKCTQLIDYQKVPETRLELVQVLPHRLLRPACLPISPPGLIKKELMKCARNEIRTRTPKRRHPLKVVRLPISPPGHF